LIEDKFGGISLSVWNRNFWARNLIKIVLVYILIDLFQTN